MNQPTIDEQMQQQAMIQQQQAQAQQQAAEQANAQQAAMMQNAMAQNAMMQQGQSVDMDMQTGQSGITGWDGRTFDQAQQGQMI